MQKIFFVRAEWDQEASVWVATSDDVPGLVTEAETLEDLSAKLERMIPELLEANGMLLDVEIPYELLARRFSATQAVAA
jgi:predicted RNase H-like HicB family nuclease